MDMHCCRASARLWLMLSQFGDGADAAVTLWKRTSVKVTAAAFWLDRPRRPQYRCGHLRVALVQGNVGIREKGNAAYFEVNVERYRKLSEPLQDDVDVLIWPESVSQFWAPADAKRPLPMMSSAPLVL